MKKIVWALLIISTFLLISCSSSTDATVDAPAIVSDLDSPPAVSVGTKVTFYAGASGENLSYLWQRLTLDASNNPITATDVVGETNDTLSLVVTALDNGVGYRCIVSNEGGSDTTKIAKLAVSTEATAPVIMEDLSPVTALDGTSFTINLNVLGQNLTYLWEGVTIDAQGVVTVIDTVPGAVTASLSGTVSALNTGKMYRCITSNSAGSDTSAIAGIYLLNPSVDLTGFAVNGATSSRPALMKQVGDKIFIGMQRLDGDDFWTPTEPSVILVVDSKTNTPLDTITCAGRNISDMEVVGDYLYVVTPGRLAETDGGLVEKISLTDYTNIETVFSSPTVDITNIEHYSGEQFFVATYTLDASWKGSAPVYLCDFTTDTFIETVTGVENCNSLVYDSETAFLYIAEAPLTSKSEVKLYNTATKEVTSIPTTLGVTSMSMYGSGTDKRIVITESDYSTGFLGEIKNGMYKQVLSIHSDAHVECIDNEIYVLEKYGKDNLMKLNSNYGVVYQNPLDAGYNPYAVLISNGVGFLISYELATLNTFVPATGILN